MKQPSLVRLGLLIMYLFCIGCGDGAWIRERPESPWAGVLRNRDELLLELEPNKQIGAYVDLSGFENFRPGSRWKSPLVKKVNGGTIRVKRRIVESEGEAAEVWELTFLPRDQNRAEILSPEVVRLLDRWPGVTSVSVSSHGWKGETAIASLRDGKVISVYWANQNSEPRLLSR